MSCLDIWLADKQLDSLDIMGVGYNGSGERDTSMFVGSIVNLQHVSHFLGFPNMIILY